MFQAGKAYAVARGEDADGGLDKTVGDPVALADAVAGPGGGTTEERALRRKVLVFYVDKSPALVRTGTPQFLPYEGQNINTVQWDFLLRGMDLDPFDPSVVGPAAGGATPKMVLRFKVTLYGKNLAGRDTSWTYVTPEGQTLITRYENRDPLNPKLMPATLSFPLSFVPGGNGTSMAANPFASGPIKVSIQICDCTECESAPGQGRCVDGIDPATGSVPDRPGYSSANVITVNYTRPVTAPDLETTSSTAGRPGPDPSGRRD